MKDSENPIYIAIHNAIHDGSEYVIIGNDKLPVQINKNNNCRFVKYNNISFMEQNKSKSSKWADLANVGEHITWGIRPGNWIMIHTK